MPDRSGHNHLLRHVRNAALALLCFGALAFGDTNEQPVGLILSPGGSKLLRLNTEAPLAARAGDLLFIGDSLKTEAGPVSFLFCPAKEMQTLGPSGEVRLDAKEP